MSVCLSQFSFGSSPLVISLTDFLPFLFPCNRAILGLVAVVVVVVVVVIVIRRKRRNREGGRRLRDAQFRFFREEGGEWKVMEER